MLFRLLKIYPLNGVLLERHSISHLRHERRVAVLHEQHFIARLRCDKNLAPRVGDARLAPRRPRGSVLTPLLSSCNKTLRIPGTSRNKSAKMRLSRRHGKGAGRKDNLAASASILEKHGRKSNVVAFVRT